MAKRVDLEPPYSIPVEACLDAITGVLHLYEIDFTVNIIWTDKDSNLLGQAIRHSMPLKQRKGPFFKSYQPEKKVAKRK